jgi:hypothetical protein
MEQCLFTNTTISPGKENMSSSLQSYCPSPVICFLLERHIKCSDGSDSAEEELVHLQELRLTLQNLMRVGVFFFLSIFTQCEA